MSTKPPEREPSRTGSNKPEILVGRWGEEERQAAEALRKAKRVKKEAKRVKNAERSAWLSGTGPPPKLKRKRVKGGNTPFWSLPPTGKIKEIATSVGGQPGFKRKRRPK